MAFIVSAPHRTVCDDHARVLARHGLLKGYFSGNRRGTEGVPGELTYLNPLFGLFIIGTRRYLPGYTAEWLRAASHPVFDRWVGLDVKPGDHVISSYGYANRCFKKARSGGGKTFVDAGNSHPENFWNTVQEEHRKWRISRPPYPPNWNRQGIRMLEDTDFILSPSSYVSDSFTARGFTPEQILHLPYPIDFSLFHPRTELAIPASPLRVVCTGSVSLRKGFPYLLEAMRLVLKEQDAVLVLTDQVESSMKDILPRYADVPIEWTDSLSHGQLGDHLKKCHVFALLSLEDGFARTVTEALACGLPAVVSENTGAKDCIRPGVNGEIVPVRDPAAAAAAILACHARQLKDGPPSAGTLMEDLSFASFESSFMSQLAKLGFVAKV
jgi:glycosyltransferase involved in cell wall biosynthesis